jgi:type II pantothenate kinase
LIQKEDQSGGRRVGVDAGATFAKIAQLGSELAPRFALVPAGDLAGVVRTVTELAPASVGLTGGGATRLAGRLDLPTQRVDEFTAWGRGAARLMEEAGQTVEERYLLVSVGTGTSVLLLDQTRAVRVGGTALGGGTVVGLGAALIGKTGFQELCDLAQHGHRAGVDLRVSDIYGPNEISLPGEFTAACFGKLAQPLPEAEANLPAASPADLAAGIMGLVGENVALICAGLAALTQVDQIIYGGTTLRHNPQLVAVLAAVTASTGRAADFLPHGEFAGAVGALELA